MACRVDRLIFVLFEVSLDDGRVKTFRSILSNKRGFQSVNRKFCLCKPVSGYWMRFNIREMTAHSPASSEALSSIIIPTFAKSLFIYEEKAKRDYCNWLEGSARRIHSIGNHESFVFTFVLKAFEPYECLSWEISYICVAKEEEWISLLLLNVFGRQMLFSPPPRFGLGMSLIISLATSFASTRKLFQSRCLFQ